MAGLPWATSHIHALALWHPLGSLILPRQIPLGTEYLRYWKTLLTVNGRRSSFSPQIGMSSSSSVPMVHCRILSRKAFHSLARLSGSSPWHSDTAAGSPVLSGSVLSVSSCFPLPGRLLLSPRLIMFSILPSPRIQETQVFITFQVERIPFHVGEPIGIWMLRMKPTWFCPLPQGLMEEGRA